MPEDQNGRLKELTEQIYALYDERRTILQQTAGEEVEDYEFTASDGTKQSLSSLFAGKDELIVVHNMGKSCPYCTLWADGLNGIVDHLADRAGFVVSSPDTPEVQRDFADGRGWRFPMVSTEGTTFAKDVGFEVTHNGETGVYPGYSVFSREEDGSIRRRGKDFFGPMDTYAGIWHMFAMLPKGSDEWHPRYSYAAEETNG